MKISSITFENGRETNQDRMFIIPKVIDKKKVLAALVADGMGGSKKGDVASGFVKDIFEQWFEKEAPSIIEEGKLSDLKRSITECAESVNEKTVEWTKESGETSGSTLVFLILKDGEYIACSIGDSRIYKFSSKPLQITKDHTLAALEVEKGNLTEEEAKTDKRSHKLVRCIGFDDETNLDFFKGKYKDGDFFLLCSDGMYNTLDIKEIESVIKGEGKTKEKLSKLYELVKKNGEKDNVTGILIEC